MNLPTPPGRPRALVEPEDRAGGSEIVRRPAERREKASIDASERAEAREEARRADIDAAHFLGLAALYADRDEYAAALECIELSRRKAPTLPYSYKLRGKLLLRLRRQEEAAEEFYRALRYNPFDREVTDCLGQIEYERKRFVAALEATVDAFLLLDHESAAVATRLRRRVRALKRLLCWDNDRLVDLFRRRQQRLTTAFDRLHFQRDLARAEEAEERVESAPARSIRSRLREIVALTAGPSPLSESSLLAVSGIASSEIFRAGEVIYPEGDESGDLLILDRGRVGVRRVTSSGDLWLADLEPGQLFGEVAFVDGRACTDRAEALSTCTVIRLDRQRLHELVEAEPSIGVELYSGLWQLLATNLRRSNDRLDDIFEQAGVSRDVDVGAPSRSRPTVTESGGGAGIVPRQASGGAAGVRLFREQGLSGTDLLTLASYAGERRLTGGSHLFRQGDRGACLFVVLEGEIRISREIAGAGEEALAILGRGEFFGEMSLIDGQPRSADARCHRGSARVLELDRDSIARALAGDARSSMQFQRLMCRILASRLREVSEKIILWQILERHR